MLCMFSYPRHLKSGHITCYLNRTYDVLTTARMGLHCGIGLSRVKCDSRTVLGRGVEQMRALSLLLIALFLSCLVACGGSSYSAPQNPVFTSTPVTAASQGASYMYHMTATDPSGGTVTFSLTTAPAGAALSGATITWGPTAAESR